MIDAVRWVLLPGLDGSGRLFKGFIRYMPRDTAPVVVTYPDEGWSSVQDLVLAIESALPTQAPFVMIAESFSGPLALRLASLAAVKPEAVVLCASFAGSPIGWVEAELARFAVPLLARWKIPAWLIRRYLLGSVPVELVEEFRSTLNGLSSEALASRFGALNEFRRWAPPSLSVPILYVRATRDRLVGIGEARRVMRHYPQAELREIEAPHFVLQSAPDEAVRIILDFLLRRTRIST